MDWLERCNSEALDSYAQMCSEETVHSTSVIEGSYMFDRIALPACSFAALVLVTACEPIRQTHGYAPRPGQLAELKVGSDGKADVAGKIGRPTTVGAFDNDEWYYITRSTESRAFLEPRVVSQQVVVVGFNESGLTESVDSYGLEDGRVVNLVTKTTPTRGKRLTFLQQLLGNVGRVTGEQIFGGAPSPGR